MAGFDIFKTFKLDFLEGWGDGCYIKFRPPAAREAKDIAIFSFNKDNPQEMKDAWERALKVLKEKFVEGKGLKDGAIVDITADELEELPIDVIDKCFGFLLGVNAEKKKD